MKLTLLHLSDVHFRANWPEEVDLVCNRFFEDLDAQPKTNDPKFLIFSGDFVQSGGDPALYESFCLKFDKALTSAGFPKERRISVPGNHDVSRPSIQPIIPLQKGALSNIADERTFNDHVRELSNLMFEKTFSNYKKFEERFSQFNCCTNQLGGNGWEIVPGVGVYCLNTSLCSFGGIDDATGKPISDRGQLMIDTRSLYSWLHDCQAAYKILVMHHPPEWLSPWARAELERVIPSSFHLVFSGHVHESSMTLARRGGGGSVLCVAPALFSRKSDTLGYCFVEVDVATRTSSAQYRQWASNHTFVKGTGLAGCDSGSVQFSLNNGSAFEHLTVLSQIASSTTLELLQAELTEAATNYSSKRCIWVDRDLASYSEANGDTTGPDTFTQESISRNIRNCTIRAPKQYGLSCLGRALAVEHHKHHQREQTLLMFDGSSMPHHIAAIEETITKRCKELQVEIASIGGFIIDNWNDDSGTRRIRKELAKAYPQLPIVLLQNIDDCSRISEVIEADEQVAQEYIYLWALSRNRVRELVVAYLQNTSASLDEDAVTQKIIDDIDALNIHRTPSNCLLMLKLTEHAFDESPVNRTEMIGRVLYILFVKFDKVPRYAIRPDLKDCEYALGFFCEWLMRTSKALFTKKEFSDKVQEYCSKRMLDLDIEVLFSFLATEHIFIRKGIEFEFRFSYWLYYFAAHRMHHDSDFANYILGERRYSVFPEIVEFYAGIDRRRADAVKRLTEDLREMNTAFSTRTGISGEFNPYQHASWSPNAFQVEALRKQVQEGMASSKLPTSVKDAIADQNYDRSRPYRQELAKFINAASFEQMILAMRGAARVLRNSDHVSPEEKTMLLEEVLKCWERICQILAILSPALTEHGRVSFEGIGFYLGKQFETKLNPIARWEELMTCFPANVTNWYQSDLFSKKMGALLTNYLKGHEGRISEILVLLLLVRQKPHGWANEIQRFIVKANKNAFSLNQVYVVLYNEFQVGFSNEATRQDLKRLAAMAIAKHATGSKVPNSKLIERAAHELFDNDKTKGD